MPKKVLVALPVGLLEQIDFVAQVEHRNRSDLIREALRRYIGQFRATPRPAPEPLVPPRQLEPAVTLTGITLVEPLTPEERLHKLLNSRTEQ